MTTLIIGPDEHKRIAEIIAEAKAHPIPLSVLRHGLMDDTDMLTLEQRRKMRPDFVRPISASMIFPGGYRAAFSIEEQPSGFCTHLSISIDGHHKGKAPSPAAVEMIARAFGVPFPPHKGWMEEYQPGEYAINLVSLYGPPSTEGHA